MKCVYFISFSHSKGFGNTEVTTGTPIDDFDKVCQIRDLIESNEEELCDIIILNYILLNHSGSDKEREDDRGGGAF